MRPESQAVFEKAKTTSSEEYKAIVKEVESLQQARLKYMQSWNILIPPEALRTAQHFL